MFWWWGWGGWNLFGVFFGLIALVIKWSVIVPVLRTSAPQLKICKSIWYHSEESSLVTASLCLLYLHFLNCTVTRVDLLCRMQLVPDMLL